MIRRDCDWRECKQAAEKSVMIGGHNFDLCTPHQRGLLDMLNPEVSRLATRSYGKNLEDVLGEDKT